MKKQNSTNLQKEWIVDFKGENSSLCYNLNFLWNKENIYIMDNHRAALWCWLQKLDKDKKYDLFHLDRHFDTLYSNMDMWLQELPVLDGLKLDTYLNLKEKISKAPIIRYDNYLSIFLERYPQFLDCCWFSTYNEGDKPRWKNIHNPSPKALPSSFEYWLNESKNKWIINIDIDLFFCDDDNDGQMKMHSDLFIESIGKSLRKQMDKGNIAVVTIALSPEWSGGWDNARYACDILTQAMGINFKLRKN